MKREKRTLLLQRMSLVRSTKVYKVNRREKRKERDVMKISIEVRSPLCRHIHLYIYIYRREKGNRTNARELKSPSTTLSLFSFFLPTHTPKCERAFRRWQVDEKRVTIFFVIKRDFLLENLFYIKLCVRQLFFEVENSCFTF
jgi:hypothetical protein